MSYILDALRKADAQRSRDPARGIHAQPALITATGAADSHARPWWWLGAAGAALLAGGAAWWALRPAPVQPLEAQQPAAVVLVEPAAAPVIPAPATEVLPPAPPAVAAPPTAPVDAGKSVRPAAPATTATAATAAIAAAPSAAAAALAAPRTASIAAAPATAAASAASLPAPVAAASGLTSASPSTTAAAAERSYNLADLPPDVRAALPKFSVDGGVYSGNVAQRMLVVNGQLFNEGSEIAPGVVLEQIRPRMAMLKFRGLRIAQPY